MKPTVGLEPTTYRLDSFAVSILKMEGEGGFEPSSLNFAVTITNQNSRLYQFGDIPP